MRVRVPPRKEQQYAGSQRRQRHHGEHQQKLAETEAMYPRGSEQGDGRDSFSEEQRRANSPVFSGVAPNNELA